MLTALGLMGPLWRSPNPRDADLSSDASVLMLPSSDGKEGSDLPRTPFA